MEEHNYKLIPLLRYSSLILLFLALTAQADANEILVPNYDNVEAKVKLFDDRVRKPLILSCNITQAGNYKLSWTRNGTDVSQDPQLKGRYEVIDKENKFIIAKPDEKDAGVYSCSVPELQAIKEINVIANVYFKYLADSIAVVEGEKLTIHCIAFGTDPQIFWLIGNQTLHESSDRIILSEDENNIKNAILTIEHAVLEDRSLYNCTATNDATKYGAAFNYEPAKEFTYIRVKGKLAALWPFLGICAEVFVLCAVILVYEKRRNKAEMDESDTDQSPEQEKLSGKK